MTRRSWFKTALAANGAAVLATAAPAHGIVTVGSDKQLLLDDLLVSHTDRISRVTARADKHPANPILKADQPWERARGGSPSGGIQISGQSVLWDDEEKLFKMWYVATGDEHDRFRRWCYATSKDGLSWEKPDLGLYEFEGSRHNNWLQPYVWQGGGYFNVMKDPRDADPGRRYKALGAGKLRNKTNGLVVAFSPDGIRWTDHPRNPLIPLGTEIADVPTMLGWDSRLGKYVYYPRPGHGLAPEFDTGGPHAHRRSVGYSESDDFETWTSNRVMLAPDTADRVDWQYYQLTSCLHEGWYIGLMAMHSTYEQTFDTYLLSSRDGFHWTWLDRRVPVLGHGEIGSYDGGYLTPSGPIVHDGKIWIYYGAYAGGHSGLPNRRGYNRMTIALATLPADRWSGLLSGPTRATITTRAMFFKGSRLFVDIEAGLPIYKSKTGRGADECEFRASLLDPSGGRIEGYGLERSKVLTGSGPREIAWEGSPALSSLEGKPVCLHFELRNCALYSFQFRA